MPSVLITGCNSGIGFNTTELFLQNNYDVFGIDLEDSNLKKLNGKYKHRFIFQKFDLLETNKYSELFKNIDAKKMVHLTFL